MGLCFSSDSDFSNRNKPSAIVVSVAGELRCYPFPVTVSEVLQSETLSSNDFFICNSDRLYFDHYIPSLEPQEELEPSQIYFLLPTAKLQHRLAAADMAALAVKASAALNASDNSRKRKSRISPALVAEEDLESVHQIQIPIRSKNAVSRSGPTRKLQKFSSRRAKLAVRSFRMRLTTINEGSVLLMN